MTALPVTLFFLADLARIRPVSTRRHLLRLTASNVLHFGQDDQQAACLRTGRSRQDAMEAFNIRQGRTVARGRA